LKFNGVLIDLLLDVVVLVSECKSFSSVVLYTKAKKKKQKKVYELVVVMKFDEATTTEKRETVGWSRLLYESF